MQFLRYSKPQFSHIKLKCTSRVNKNVLYTCSGCLSILIWQFHIILQGSCYNQINCGFPLRLYLSLRIVRTSRANTYKISQFLAQRSFSTNPSCHLILLERSHRMSLFNWVKFFKFKLSHDSKILRKILCRKQILLIYMLLLPKTKMVPQFPLYFHQAL